MIGTKRSLTDMVSAADRDTETLIRQALGAACPDDAQLGEEHGLSPGSSGMTWVIDPIDGTAPYRNGLPGWCVSIGLMDEGRPLLGAIFAPALDEMFLGACGLGATLNSQPIRVTDRFTLESGLLGTRANDRVPAARIGQIYADRAQAGIAWARYGSGASMLAYVAAGRLTGYAIIKAAGGRIGAVPQGPGTLDSMAVLATIPSGHARLLTLTRFDDQDWRL